MTTMLQKSTRGIRNNNPANIRRSSARWRGMFTRSEIEWYGRPYDPDFCQFLTIDFGVRAFLCLLRTYIHKYDVRSIAQFVHRFAPDSDGNDESAYCSYICKCINTRMRLGIDCNDSILNTGEGSTSFNKRIPTPSSVLFEFSRAVFLVESGYVLSPVVFERAFQML